MGKRPSLASGLQTLVAAAATAVALLTPGLNAPREPPVLGVSGTRLTVDGTPRFLLVVSYFDALRAADAVLELDFAWLRRHGIDGVRVFPNWWRCQAMDRCGGHPGQDTLMAPDGSLRPDPLARLRAVLAKAAAHGLVVDLSFARETVRDAGGDELTPARYAEALVAATAAIQPAPHVMIDVQNEVYKNRVFVDQGEADARRVGALLRRVDRRGRLVFVSANVEEIERYAYCGVAGACPDGAAPADLLAVHDAREPNWHDRTPAVVRDLLALGARRGARPVYLQEPQPWQDERAPDRLERFLDAASRAKRAGAAAWTFHTRTGFILRDGKSMHAQMSADERRFIELIRRRLDSEK
jgi:hypothetical protein